MQYVDYTQYDISFDLIKYKKGDKYIDVNNYYFYRSSDGGKSYSRIVGYNLANVSDNSFTFRDNGRDGSKSYLYLVAAFDSPSEKPIQIGVASPNNSPRLSGLTTEPNSETSILLNWDKASGADGYYIYRSEDKKAFKLIKIVGSGTTSYEDKNLRQDSKYYYKVCAYTKGSENISLLGYTVKAVATYYQKCAGSSEVILADFTDISKTTCDYFKEKWPNEVNNPNNDKMAIQYKTAPGSTGNCELQIHIYFFITGDPAEIKLKESSFINGIKSMWGGVVVTNSALNFPYTVDGKFKSILFVTKVVPHIYHTMPTDGQNVITVYLGGEECKHPISNGKSVYWYFGSRTLATIWMASDKDILNNSVSSGYNSPYPDSKYGKVAAHEIGHILGLNDAYYDTNEKIERLIANNETVVRIIRSYSKVVSYENVMSLPSFVNIATPNDIEMILYAYRTLYIKAVVVSYSYESYKDFNSPTYGPGYLSKMIRDSKPIPWYNHN